MLSSPDLTEFLQAVAWTAAAVSAGLAIVAYRRGVRQHMAQSLVEIEKRFADFADTARWIDPDSGQFKSELAPHIRLSLTRRARGPGETYSSDHLQKLDGLLRFLLLVSSLHEHRILSRRAIAHQYSYWFRAIWENKRLLAYVRVYFPTVMEFMRRNRRTITVPNRAPWFVRQFAAYIRRFRRFRWRARRRNSGVPRSRQFGPRERR